MGSKSRLEIIQSYRILDTPPEEAFDNLTKLAVGIFETEISLITIITDDRQWFKSKVGHELKETPIALALCQDLIVHRKDSLVINDLKSSEKYCEHPSFAQYGIRFYAGCPLVTNDGVVLGSFCIMDYQPRQFPENRLALLKSLAHQAMELLEYHKQKVTISLENNLLKKTTRITDRASEIGKLGGIYLDLGKGYLYWQPGNNMILNLRNGFTIDFQDFIHPESNPEIAENRSMCELFLYLNQKIHEKSNSGFSEDWKLLHSEKPPKLIQVVFQRSEDDVYIILKDNSDLDEIRNELLKSRALLEEVEAISKIGGWELDVSTKKLTWTKNTYAIYDLDGSDEITPEKVKSFYPDSNYQLLTRDLKDALKNRTDYYREYLFQSDKSQTKWVRIKGRPIFKDGKLTKLIGSVQDVTEDVQMREEIRVLKNEALTRAEYFESLVNNQSFYVIKLDLGGNYTFVNEFFIRNFKEQKNAEDFIGESFLSTVEEEEIAHCHTAIAESIVHPGATKQVNLRRRNFEGELVISQWEFKGLASRGEEVDEILCIGSDITELMEKKNDLLNLVQVVSDQNRRLVEFTHIVSHNIRSHITNLQGLSNLIELIDKEKDKDKYFKLLKEAIGKLDDTIKDLNSIIQIQNKQNLSWEKIKLYDIVTKIIRNFSKEVSNYAIEIELTISRKIRINTVPVYLENILTQLIANAIVYRSLDKKPFIKITCENKMNDQFCIVVEDNGIGIDLKKHKKRLFKFYQTLHPKRGFKGKGLFLVKAQVEALGGNIDLESRVNEGTKFTICLPNEKN